MKKEIYEYICGHDHVDIHEVSKALNIDELLVLHYLNELHSDSYIKISAIIPLDPSNNNSCYYSATGKKYFKD